MKEIVICLFGVLFALVDSFYQKYQFADTKQKRNLKWKIVRVVRMFLIYGFAFLDIYFKYTLQDMFLSSGIYWVVFEIGTNAISLGADWFYVGASGIDAKFKVKKWVIVFGYFLLTLAIKLFI